MRAGIVQTAAVVEVWPENEDAFHVFSSAMTQWRIGMGGPTGLDYAALPVIMDFAGITQDRSEIFTAIRIMESEALNVFSSNRDRAK